MYFEKLVASWLSVVSNSSSPSTSIVGRIHMMIIPKVKPPRSHTGADTTWEEASSSQAIGSQTPEVCGEEVAVDRANN